MFRRAIANKESGPANPAPLAPPFDTEERLSDLNPLFNGVELHIPSSAAGFKSVTLSLIDQNGGLKPDVLKAMIVSSGDPKIPPAYRFIARFELGSLTNKKIGYLEDLVKYIYGTNSRTRKNSDSVDLPAVRYPPADNQSIEELSNTRLEGWYMGPNTADLTPLHEGLYLFRDVGVTNKRNFLQKSQVKNPKYIVEIREASLYQTDLANLVVETSKILKDGKPLEYGRLMYDTYYALMRSSLKKEEEGYDLDKIIGPINQGLIFPLANPNLANAIKQEPESTVLCGVPGTGKSLGARKLFSQDTGVFIIPMDPLQLARDIEQPPEKRVLLPRITQIRSLTRKPVVLQLDDVEKLFDKGNRTSSTLLNLMSGVQEQGFYVLASTNEPEQIDSALLQPQRLGVVVYCGLPDEEARLNMLEMHTPMYTPNMSPLFSSRDVRDIILKYIAENTKDFPPRQLGKIATNAKAILLERVTKQTGRVHGLSEDDLNGAAFTVEDWEIALNKTLESFDLDSSKIRDQQIRDFVIHHQQNPLGFAAIPPERRRSFDIVREQIASKEQ